MIKNRNSPLRKTIGKKIHELCKYIAPYSSNIAFIRFVQRNTEEFVQIFKDYNDVSGVNDIEELITSYQSRCKIINETIDNIPNKSAGKHGYNNHIKALNLRLQCYQEIISELKELVNEERP